MPSLLIVDDHQLFAEGIKLLIEASTDYRVVSLLHNGRDVLPFLAHHTVDLLVVDVDLPDLSGYEVTRLVRARYTQTKVLALSMFDDSQSIQRMIEAGAHGYCVKSAGREELFTAIRQVSNGEGYLPIDYLQRYRNQKTVAETCLLTGRETEVIRLIAEGATTKGIANKLFLSSRTVETHRKNIYRKLGIHTNVELTLYVRSGHLV